MCRLFAVGLVVDWPQFPGLQAKLENYYQPMVAQLPDFTDVIGVEMVDIAQSACAAKQASVLLITRVNFDPGQPVP